MIKYMDDYFSWDLISDDGEELYVPQGSNAMVRDGTIFADDIGCCIGIGIYDSENEVGYLSHLDTVRRDKEDYMAQLNVFMEIMPELNHPEVLLVGGAQPDVRDTIDADFADSTAMDTYHVGGLKNTTARILNESYLGEVEIDHPADQDTELYIDSQEGMNIFHRD